ncbi:uncharacterized protein F5Z01DRAFT_626503 [Emericellopsis atlantica]|uniref:RING-type domain-containing protein n=1 Tax=Emericellopsis atlantica TaxID=2614577 RepID=A0A9P8CNK5_9HYPO|nr:uncharacterized protein F5Z01DRAFT_626503 [Emericellopsis atlantica]KAG9251821.1 hypothetical protein F5Z01DRAFT_626503 [Emericellopsis atlantica]
MEHTLTCNNLKCRTELAEKALVTTCSHIFCLECAQQLGITAQSSNRRITCPACREVLSNPDDAVITKLNPSEDYKTSVLSGLSPDVIMECAGRALSFWTYQTNQEICYQRHLYKTLTDKYSVLNLQLDKTVNDANAELESLHQKHETLTAECEGMRRRNEGLVQQYRDKTRQVLQLQEAYDKVKRKVEVGEIEKAAFNAVDSSILHAAQQATQTYDAHNYARPQQQPGQAPDHASTMNSRQSRAPNLGLGFGNRTWATQRVSPRIGTT